MGNPVDREEYRDHLKDCRENHNDIGKNIQKMNSEITELKVIVARMDERDERVFGSLADGKITFGDLKDAIKNIDGRVGKLEMTKAKILGIWAFMALLIPITGNLIIKVGELIFKYFTNLSQ